MQYTIIKKCSYITGFDIFIQSSKFAKKAKKFKNKLEAEDFITDHSLVDCRINPHVIVALTSYRHTTEQFLKDNNLEDGIEARFIKKGERVRRKPDAKTIWRLIGFDNSIVKFELQDCNDLERSLFVKSCTKLYLKF